MKKISFHIPEQLDRRKAYTWLASWFGCGFLNPAPGTWGSLGALPFGIVIYAYGGIFSLFVCAVIITIIGLWAADLFDKDMGGHDSKMIVIDEVAGQWIAMLPAMGNPFLILLSFFFFRFFDILKPGPIGWADKNLEGAKGVMFDDVIAGIFAAFIIFGITIVI